MSTPVMQLFMQIPPIPSPISPPPPPTLPKENSMKITVPVMVGDCNILVASENKLVQLIRQAKAEIESNEDLAEISQTFARRANDLQKVIDLCVKQLDDRITETS